MKDRVPLYPGRVKLTPVSGQANTYDMVRADQPTQEGTPLNKASLLKDTTAALFGLGSDAVPNDVLNVLSRFQSGMGNEHIWKRSDGAYVNSPNANAYPPSVDDGYTYEYLGRLGKKTRAVTGTYTGDGNDGREIALGFAPQAVFIAGYMAGAYGFGMSLKSGGGVYGSYSTIGQMSQVSCTGNGFKVGVGYANNGNQSGQRYDYLAIG